MKCLECNKEVKNLKALTTHIQFKHSNEQQAYYDKHLKKETEGFCKCCNQPTKFDSIHTGYPVYCSKKCMKTDYSKEKKVHNPMHSKEAKQNQKDTNLERYGVTQNTKRPEIKEQIKQTNLKKYGVENVAQNKKIKTKALKSRKATCLKEYGVNSYLSVPNVKEKIKNTNIERYGSEFPMHNNEVFINHLKNSCAAKKFEELYYRGSYEKDFLDNFYNKIKIEQGLSFKYKMDGKKKMYYSDFYLPTLNLVVEVKNSYLVKRDKRAIKLKKQAAINEGYDYIMIIDKDYSQFNTLYNTTNIENSLLF